jgi:hypothetical protein
MALRDLPPGVVPLPFGIGGRAGIATPFQFVLTGGERLRIIAANAAAGVVLEVRARILHPDGTITPQSWRMTPATDRSVTSVTAPLTAGALLNLAVIVVSGAPNIGQCFAIVQLLVGSLEAGTFIGVLTSGYLTTWQWLGWPGSPIIPSTDGEPNVRTIVGTAPALGDGISETVPTGARWELLAVYHTVTRGAGLIGGTPQFFLTAASTTAARVPSQQPIPSGGTDAELSWLAGYSTPVTATSGVLASCIPVGLQLPAGASFGITCPFVSYQYSAPTYIVREWLEVN